MCVVETRHYGMRILTPLLCIAWLGTSGCGDNIQSPGTPSSIGTPRDVKAYSVGFSSVNVSWSAPANGTDSLLAGYIVGTGAYLDSVAAGVLNYRFDSLSQGARTFTVRSYRAGGAQSDVVGIVWAPAERFDTPYTLFENNTVISSRPEGFNVGTRTTNPSTTALEASAQTTMDFYIDGGIGGVQRPLAMVSASRYQAGWNETRFSTVAHAASSLDFPLSSFPAEITFTRDSVEIADNMIYYLHVIGDPGESNYARLHVRFISGTSFPDRQIQIRVSLQRLPGVLYALHRGRLSPLRIDPHATIRRVFG